MEADHSADQPVAERFKIPDIEWDFPPCPLCGRTLEGDPDTLWCENCEVFWTEKGTKGKWREPEQPTCGHRATFYKDNTHVCVLSEGHRRLHVGPHTEHDHWFALWNDKGQRVSDWP